MLEEKDLRALENMAPAILAEFGQNLEIGRAKSCRSLIRAGGKLELERANH
jgi:hypothetical protein